MKNFCLTLFALVISVCSIYAQKDKKSDSNADHFLVKGSVFEVDMFSEGSEKKASNVQVVVYQEKELYVAFFSDDAGSYSFYLPIGFQYEIWFGGSAFVNKKVAIDATQFPQSKRPSTVPLDLGLFRPIDGYEFPELNEPFVKVNYDIESDQILPDLDYSEQKSAELAKGFKKIQKEQGKKKK